MYFYKTIYILIFLWLPLLLGCKSQYSTSSKSPSSLIQDNALSVPAILTFILRITKSEKNVNPTVELYKMIEGKGYLKKQNYGSVTKPNGSFIVELINKGGDVIQVESFSNPLHKNYEYVDENGNFQHKEVELTEEYVSIRILKIGHISALHVYLIDEKKQILLQKIKL